jgi:hypothetical protein
MRVWWQISRLKWHHGCDDVTECTKGKHRQACPTKNCPKAKRTSGRPHKCITADDERLCPKGCNRHATTCPKRVGGGLVFRKPKGKSKRTIPLPAELIPMLKAHRTREKAERLKAGNIWDDHDLVFAQPNGRPIDPRDDWDDWKALLAAAGVRDARVHDGRHTAGTLLIEQGYMPARFRRSSGTPIFRLVQRYKHVASPMADGMQRMGQALWGAQ